MDVVCNGVRCCLEVQGSLVSCKPLNSAEEAGDHVFARSEISQLLRSRRDKGSVKVVVGNKSFLLRFANPDDREVFIDMVQKMEAYTEGDDKWITSTICQVGVELGLFDEATLESLIKEEISRGVVLTFDAIGSLVDPKTLRLCPITDQLENDIFRQVPVLAKIFEKRVTDEETRQQFWEAVVRKYFCFSRTFLEEDMLELETENAAECASVTPENLSSINLASGRALPKAKLLVSHQLSKSQTQKAMRPRQHARFFSGRPLLSRPRLRRAQHVVMQPLSASAEVCQPPVVSRVIPKESTNREALEFLRRFWRGDINKKKELQAKLKHILNFSNSGWQRRCVLRAGEFLEELGYKDCGN